MHSTQSIMYGVAKWRELGVVKYEVWNRDWVGAKSAELSPWIYVRTKSASFRQSITRGESSCRCSDFGNAKKGPKSGIERARRLATALKNQEDIRVALFIPGYYFFRIKVASMSFVILVTYS